MNNAVYQLILIIIFLVIMTILKFINFKKAIIVFALFSLLIIPRYFYHNHKLNKAMSFESVGREVIASSKKNIYRSHINLNDNSILESNGMKYIDIICNRPVFMSFHVPHKAYLNFMVLIKDLRRRPLHRVNAHYSLRLTIMDELGRMKTAMEFPISRDSQNIGKDFNLNLSRYYGQNIHISINILIVGPQEILLGSRTPRINKFLIRYPVLYN